MPYVAIVVFFGIIFLPLIPPLVSTSVGAAERSREWMRTVRKRWQRHHVL